MALSIDDAVGGIVDELRGRRMWAETMLVFLSDNGGGYEQQGSNRPLRGSKGGTLEGGIRTAAAVGGGWLPPRLRGQTSSHLMSVADWYPTLCDAAGVGADDERSRDVAPVDGSSMLPWWLEGGRGRPLDGPSAADRTILVDSTIAIASVARGGGGAPEPRRRTGCTEPSVRIPCWKCACRWRARPTSRFRARLDACFAGGGRALYKLSTSDLTLCARTVAPSCVPPTRALTAEEAAAGWGEACSAEAPCRRAPRTRTHRAPRPRSPSVPSVPSAHLSTDVAAP